jgi:hypothetical protein
VLFFGPEASHVGDIFQAGDIGRVVAHGDAHAAVTAIRELVALASFANDGDQQIAALAQLVTLPDAEPDDFVDLAELRAARRGFARLFTRSV